MRKYKYADIENIINHIAESGNPDHMNEIRMQEQSHCRTDNSRGSGNGIIAVVEVFSLLFSRIAFRPEADTAADDIPCDQAEQQRVKNIIIQRILKKCDKK